MRCSNVFQNIMYYSDMRGSIQTRASIKEHEGEERASRAFSGSVVGLLFEVYTEEAGRYFVAKENWPDKSYFPLKRNKYRIKGPSPPWGPFHTALV
jgi:hypothetical protein